MTQVKHIIILVLMLTGFGLLAKAQSTLQRPFEGALHTYRVNVGVGASYDFYITANADGSGLYDDGLTGEFDINNATGTVGDDGLATAQIQWNNGASSHIYYLWLEATAPGGCSNLINIQITPQANQFDLLSENVPVTNTVSCPATASADGFNASSDAYSAGYTTLTFKVLRENATINPLTASANGWSFVPTLNVDPDLSLGKVIISIAGTTSGTIAPVAGRYLVNGTDNEVIVTVSIENAPGYTRDITLSVTEQREDNTNLNDSDPSNDNATHTIEVMPIINGMGGA